MAIANASAKAVIGKVEEVPDILCCLPDRTTHTKTVQFAKTRGDKTQVEMASLWDGEISRSPFREPHNVEADRGLLKCVGRSPQSTQEF
ncbi:MAG: hypothetical protein ACBR15_15280 [Microcoleus sp.]